MKPKKIGIIGGGPAGLFMYKRLIESGHVNLDITIFERKSEVGQGMPYSTEGACNEHITNVSDNEIPELVINIKDWIRTASPELLKQFDMKPELFNEYKVVPRLLFGKYLEAQFHLLEQAAKKSGITTNIIYNTTVTDVKDNEREKQVWVLTNKDESFVFDNIVISTGHNWPVKFEGKIKNWFDSPYPPTKLAKTINHSVAIKGSSLTAIDAVRTLARHNGTFDKTSDPYTFTLNEQSADFKIVMHSIDGLLPAIRFHLEDSHLSKGSLLSTEEVKTIMDDNGGFIPLDILYQRNFLEPIRKQRPDFYAQIKDLTIEEFVERMMKLREKLDAFTLFKAEYAEAEKSIKREQSVYWKEMLAVLSYAMNYPAKHLSAEDMIRLKKVLMPLISIVIAFVPQSSCREMIALYNAGVLSLVAVDKESKVEPAKEGGAIYSYTNESGDKVKEHYKMFIDAVGQPPFMFDEFLFDGLRDGGTVSPARLWFKDPAEGIIELVAGNNQVKKDGQGYYLLVPGIAINDHFQVVDKYGAFNDRVYIMAVPYIGGLNPDYSGLDFCEEASMRIAKALLPNEHAQQNEAA